MDNMDNLDITDVTFGSAPLKSGGTTIDVTLRLKDLQAPPTTSNPNLVSGLWSVYFQYGTATGRPGGTSVHDQRQWRDCGRDLRLWNLGRRLPCRRNRRGEFHPGSMDLRSICLALRRKSG